MRIDTRHFLSGLAATAFAAVALAQSGPTAFTFAERTGVATSALVTSESKTVTGFTGALEVRVSGEGNPQYRIGAGAFTSASGSILPGQTLAVRHTSASQASTPTTSTVSVGDYNTTFKSVTGTADRTPDAFGFGTILNTFPNSFVESAPQVLTGFNAPVAIVPGPNAQYRVDGGNWTNASGTLNPGQSLTMRHLTSPVALAYTQTYLTVGGIRGTFTTRNRGANQAPIADAGADQTVDENAVVTLDGSASTDAEGALTYAWTQIAGTPVALTGADTATPTFTAPTLDADETLGFSLSVTDDEGASATDTVQVEVLDLPDLSIADAEVQEGAGSIEFTIALSPAAAREITVDFATADGSADASDYGATSGTLTLPAGATAATIAVPVTNDTADEADETFSLGLANASGAELVDGLATGTIRDDDAPVDDGELAAAAAETAARGCDFLDPANCLYPFPNDFFTTAAGDGSPQSAEQGGTGRRVNFNIAAMPRNSAGKPVDPTEWNRHDGFSPGALITTFVPNLSLEQTFGLPSHEIGVANLALSQTPDSPILVLEVDDSLLGGLFGEPARHLVWSEIDQNANLLTIVGAPNVGTQAIPGVTDERGHIARPNGDGKAALLIRPAKNFREGKRYVVVLRKLKDADGNAIAPQAGFRACAAGSSALPPVQQRCALLEQNVFPVLEDAGIGLGDVYLAWDFTVQSTANAIGRLRHMRDDAFASLSSDPADEDCTQLTAANAATCAAPQFAITHVTENPQGGIARRIEGTLTVPSYLVPFEPAPGDDAAVSGAIHTLCDNASELEGDCRGDFRDAADLGQGVTAPNRLFFRPGDGATHTDATQLPYGDGLPDSTGAMEARFLCQIPAQATPDAPARASLYGHGQLDRGVAITYEGVPDQAREHNYMFCAVDWFGFRTGDAVNVLSTLADLSNFAVVPDASQQGMLNFMFLARAMAHPRGFGALPEFQDAASGRPLFDRSEIFYDGNSQGGIFGGVVLAASKDVNRGVLGALGMNYSTLLTRSANFDEYAGVLYNSYTDPLDRQLLFSMIQMLWDRGENDGYASHLLDNSAFDGPSNDVMLAPAFGDPQVSMWTADNMARTMGGVPVDMQQTLHVESLGVEPTGPNGRRHPDVTPYYGLPAMDFADAGHTGGSVLQIWDNAQLKSKYAFVPPITNTPPYATKDDNRDPHDTSQRTVDGRCVHAHFMRTGGQVIDAMPLVYGSATCPSIPPAAPTSAPGAGGEPEVFQQIVAAIDSILGPTLQTLADALTAAATQVAELAGIALDPPGPGATPELPAPEPLLAGAAKRAIDVPVGTPLGGYLRPPVGGEYIGDDPVGEIADNAPSANDSCDPTAPESCIPNAPLPDEARTAHSPYATASPPSRGYYDSLIAKAVALYDGHDYVVMVKTDFIGMLDEVVQDVKADVKARAGVDLGDGLIMSATHSHDGPGALANHSTRYFWLAMDAYQHDVYRRLVGQLADVVIAALDDLKPARIGHGNGLESPETVNGNGINGYRRGRLDSYDDDDAPGCAFVPAGQCPAGIDDANELRKRIGILRIDDAATGAPMAVVINFADHGIAFDVENQYFSGDVLGSIEREVEQSYAKPAGDESFRAPIAMLVQNTGGDVTPKNVDYSIRGIEALGKRMAPQVRAVADGIAQFQDQPDLRAVSQRVILNRERLGYAEGEYPYPWGAAQCGNDLAVPFADVGVNDIPGYDQTGLPRKHLYCIPAMAPDAADLADNGVAENGAFVPGDTILTAAKIGAITLLAQPGEPLTEYGVRSLEMAQAEGYAPADTFIWGYAADHIGYILPPVQEDWATFGGAESTTTFWGWKQGQRFIDGHRELLRALRDGAAAPPDEFALDYSLGKQMVANVPAAQPTPSLLPGLIVQQPADIARFGRTQLVFEGGDPVLDLPHVTMLNADGTPVRRANGEVIDTFFEMHLKYRLVSGRHLWTVEFEAPKDWPTGSYRFAVAGQAYQGGDVAYQLESADFAVTPARDLQAQGLACPEGRCTVALRYRAVPLNYRNVDPLVREDDAAPMRTGQVTFTNGTDTVVVPADGSGSFAAAIGGDVTVSAVDAWGNTTPGATEPPPPPARSPVRLDELCDPFGFGCLGDLPGAGEVQGALDTAWNAVVGAVPGETPPLVQDPIDPLAFDCTGPAGDPSEGTPEFAQRDAENIFCTMERHQDSLQQPANNPYMMENYGADPYRAPARHAGTRFRHADIDIAGVDAQEGTSFHPSADSNAEVYFPCAAGTCANMPEGLQTFEPPYPIAIVMHGAASDKKHLEWVTQPLAERGYFVLTANGTGDGLPGVLLDWLFDPANPYAALLDLSRIGTAGHSLGAENATRVQGDARVSGIVAFDPCDGSGANECRDSEGSRLHDKGAAAQTPTLFLTADYLGFPGYPQPQTRVPDDLRAEGFEILRNNGVDTMLVTPRATTHLDWAGAFTFGNRLNEATSLHYTVSWFDRYVNGRLVRDASGNVVTTHGRSDAEERAHRQAIVDAAFARLTASNFDGMADLHNISQGRWDRLKAVASGDLEYGGNLPYRVDGLALADRLSFYHRSVCFIGKPDHVAGGTAARADTGVDGSMRASGCTAAQAPADADGDGVPDASDQCPAQPGPASNNGCPVEPPADADGDGVPDASDQCPDTPNGTPVDAQGCPVEEGEGFPYHCDEFFGSGYCIEDIPGVGGTVGGALDTAWNALMGGGGGEPPPAAPGESLASCALNQDPAACQAALESVAGLQDCSFDESGVNCAYEVVHDAVGVDTAANYLHALFAQCASTPASPACGAIRSVADGNDAASIPVLSRPVPRGDLVYAEAGAATPSAKTVDGAIDDWMAQGTHIGGTDLYEFGEHVYTDFLFDAYGADSGDDARRWAVLSLAGELSSRTERIDALQQAGGDQLDVPPPGGTTSDHYGDRADREDGTDLTEVRWAADAGDLYFLARVSRLQDPQNLVVLVLADTTGQAGMQGLDIGLTTGIFDRALLLRDGGGESIDLVTGAREPLAAGSAAVSATGYDNALEARLPRALLERPDGTIRVAVMTVRGAGLVPANVAYRFDEPVTIFGERAQALSLFAGSVDHFARPIAVADLAAGRTQTARPGPGYHERQFISGDNISNEADTENGRLQPYGVFVPGALAVNTLNQARMTIWTHYRGGKAHSGASWTPRLFWQLGEEQGNIVISPRARGTSTWYTTRAHQDFFEVFADAAGTDVLGQYAAQNLPAGHPFGRDGLFFVDPSRIYISGYSMGGYATFLFTGLYPDLFAGGFSQSGAVTQGAWTGIGPDAGDPGYDQSCGLRAPDDFPEVGGGTPCFIEANDGRANAQLNYRLLENTRHVPITIHHGSNDELALTPGALRMGARLAELQYRYDATTFLGYEHFTQAIMDEWRDGAVYLNRHERPGNPRAVTYKVVPALVKAINEVQPQGSSGGFDFHPDGAYWVDDLVVRDGGDGAIGEDGTVPFGRIDADSGRLAGIDYVPVPRTGTEADASAPYVSTNVISPANHSTPFVRHSLEWLQTGTLAPDANTFSATLANLSHASLDLARMGFGGHFGEAITGTVTSDGETVLTLKNVGTDMTVCVNGAPQGEVLADSDVGVALDGDAAVLLVPGLGASCSAGPVTPPPAPSAPELIVGNAATTVADLGAQIQGYLAGLVGSPATAPAQLEAAAGDVMNQAGVLRTGNAWLRRPPLNISHRGGENDWPENTMFAYAESIRAAGSDMIEMDIYETADGELVVIHDDSVDRTTNGSGSVSGMTLSQLKALDAAHWFAQDGDTRYGTSSGRDEAFYVYRGIATGARPVPAGLAALGYTPNDFRIPTLREIFENPRFASVLINIELKPDPDSTGQYEAKLAAMIRAYGRGDDVIVASFLDHNSTLFKANAPEVGTSVPTAQVAAAKAAGNPPFAPEGLNPANGITAAHVAFQVPVDFNGIPVITGEFVADAHARGIAVQAWTINDRATMIDLLNQCVDGIMSDNPLLLEEVLNSADWSCALDP